MLAFLRGHFFYPKIKIKMRDFVKINDEKALDSPKTHGTWMDADSVY